jgi:hypothetical protein
MVCWCKQALSNVSPGGQTPAAGGSRGQPKRSLSACLCPLLSFIFQRQVCDYCPCFLTRCCALCFLRLLLLLPAPSSDETLSLYAFFGEAAITHSCVMVGCASVTLLLKSPSPPSSHLLHDLLNLHLFLLLLHLPVSANVSLSLLFFHLLLFHLHLHLLFFFSSS